MVVAAQPFPSRCFRVTRPRIAPQRASVLFVRRRGTFLRIAPVG